MQTDLFSLYSDQLTNVAARPPVMNPAYDDSAKVRIKYFSVPVPTAAHAADSVIGLVIIPPDARIIGGVYQHSAFGAGRTIDIGIYGADGSGVYDTSDTADDIDFFINGDDVSASGQDSIAELVNGDLNAEYLTTKEVALAVKILGDTMPIGATFTGHIKYVVN